MLIWVGYCRHEIALHFFICPQIFHSKTKGPKKFLHKLLNPCKCKICHIIIGKEQWAIGGLVSCSQNWKQFSSNSLLTVKSDWNIIRNKYKGVQGAKENTTQNTTNCRKSSYWTLWRCLTETGKQNKDQTDAEIHHPKETRETSPDSPEMSDTIHGAPGEKLRLYVLTKLHEWPQEFIIKLKYPDAFIHSIGSREGLKKCKNVLWQQCLRGFAGEFCITSTDRLGDETQFSKPSHWKSKGAKGYEAFPLQAGDNNSASGKAVIYFKTPHIPSRRRNRLDSEA